jgi:hypothetical protein
MKINKLLFLFLLLLIPLAFFMGYLVVSFKYVVPMASCHSAKVPFENAEYVKLSMPMNTMFRNFYGQKYIFTDHIIPKGITLVEYYKTFNNGAFHYLKTTSGEIVACGFYK